MIIMAVQVNDSYTFNREDILTIKIFNGQNSLNKCITSVIHFFAGEAVKMVVFD